MQNLPSWYESTESGNDNGKKHQITAMPGVGGGSVRQRRAGDALSAGTGVRAPESTVLTAPKQLSAWYESKECARQQLGDSWQMCTHTAYAAVIERAMETKKAAPLSAAAMEVLTIVAYNQPVSKGFVEHVRGVDSSSVVNTLVEKELLMEAGRLDVPGKPIAYATTPHFLRCFGLQSLEELPPLPVSAAPQETAEETEETDTPTA
ncbi:MAG: SMC-Scp complex subunit ScpB [Ruminococcus sp.]